MESIEEEARQGHDARPKPGLPRPPSPPLKKDGLRPRAIANRPTRPPHTTTSIVCFLERATSASGTVLPLIQAISASVGCLEQA